MLNLDGTEEIKHGNCSEFRIALPPKKNKKRKQHFSDETVIIENLESEI